MAEVQSTPPGVSLKVIYVVGGLIVLSGAIALAVSHFSTTVEPTPPVKAAASSAEIQRCCTQCHVYPPPYTFPKGKWRHELEEVFKIIKKANPALDGEMDKEAIIKYYEDQAPETLTIEPDPSSQECPVRLEVSNYLLPKQTIPAVSNVYPVHLTDKKRMDIVTCDMGRFQRDGAVTVLRPYLDPEDPNRAFVVGKPGDVKHPAHVELVDLDQDGINDLIVADLGNFFPTNDKKGRVVWFKGNADGTFTAKTLLEGVGRVADVQAADFNGDGKLDLIVAVFGWRETGEILYLENVGKDKHHPEFAKPVVLDKRQGTIHVPIIDLNGDGHPDFVALISQQYETIVAFLNDGKGNFTPKTLYQGPHPSYGSSGIQLVDLNNDGKVDILYTNGDSFDSGEKPWHSVQWLENRTTDWKTPVFEPHHITKMPGVHRALAVDLEKRVDPKGRPLLDVLAVAFLPNPQSAYDSIILLRQETPGKFVRYAVERKNCAHATAAVGDLDGDGKMHLVTGSFYFSNEPTLASRPALHIWRNMGPSKKAAAP